MRLQALRDLVLAALPQTQCTRCGFPDCAAYAQAIAEQQAPLNQCPPGGQEGIERLARITGQPVLPLNPDHGVETPRTVAWIEEDTCIGCTLCIKACRPMRLWAPTSACTPSSSPIARAVSSAFRSVPWTAFELTMSVVMQRAGMLGQRLKQTWRARAMRRAAVD